MSQPTPDDRAVENFRKYLRIPSVHPDVNYDDCVTFLTALCDEVGLTYVIYKFVPLKPIIVATWTGSDPNLPSILFNSHMDVVPAYPELWTHDPWGAEMDDEGNIYGRGSQDMKCVSIMYLEAVRRLKAQGQTLKRTIHFSFVPDEEIGGRDGMKLFVTKDEFKNLNVGCGFDEGTATIEQFFKVYYAERTIWQIKYLINGTSGHGSLLLTNTAGEKLRRLVDKIFDYRQTQVDQLNSDPNLSVGDVTTVNLTIIAGGVQANVVPPQFTASLDLRVAIDNPLDEFEMMLNKWKEEAGEDVTMEFTLKDQFTEPTKLDETNPYWVAMKTKFDELGFPLTTSILNGGTDGRFVRQVGIPVIGFSPIPGTPVLMHGNDEFLNVNTFLKGIELYEELIPTIANLS